MATWNMGSKGGGSLKAKFQYDSGQVEGESFWQVEQDEKPFLEQAKLEREAGQRKDTGYKKFATIPDIVAIDIMHKYGIDIHDPNTMRDKNLMDRFKYIVKTEYKHLMSY